MKDSKSLVGDEKNYTIRTTTTFTDALISGVLNIMPIIFLAGTRVQTIRVSYATPPKYDNSNGNSGNSSGSLNKYDELKSLKELYDSGALSKEEYEKEKAKILAK